MVDSNEEKQWSKYMVMCPNCEHTFLPWKCLSITTDNTNWKTHCICPNCQKAFERDSSFINQ